MQPPCERNVIVSNPLRTSEHRVRAVHPSLLRRAGAHLTVGPRRPRFHLKDSAPGRVPSSRCARCHFAIQLEEK